MYFKVFTFNRSLGFRFLQDPQTSVKVCIWFWVINDTEKITLTKMNKSFEKNQYLEQLV